MEYALFRSGSKREQTAFIGSYVGLGCYFLGSGRLLLNGAAGGGQLSEPLMHRNPVDESFPSTITLCNTGL